MNFFPRFIDPGFTLNPLRQLVVSENLLKLEEKMCLLLLCDKKLLECIQLSEHKETERYIELQIKEKMKKFYKGSEDSFDARSKESRLKLILQYKRTLRKILGILPQKPKGSVSSFFYLIEDLKEKEAMEVETRYFQPNFSVKSIRIEFIIEIELNKRDYLKLEVEKHLNRKRNYLESYTIRPIGEYPEKEKSMQPKRIRYEISIDFHLRPPDIFDMQEFFDYFFQCYNESLMEVDSVAFGRFKSRTPNELWIKELILEIETPKIFTNMIVNRMREDYPHFSRFDKRELLNKTILEAIFSYFEPEDYLGTEDPILNLVRERPQDIFSCIAVDWALDRKFKKSYEYSQNALYALMADFLSLVYKYGNIERDTLNRMFMYILFAAEKSEERPIHRYNGEILVLEYLDLIIERIKKSRNKFIEEELYFTKEKYDTEIKNIIRDLFLFIINRKIPKRDIVKAAQVLYEKAGVTVTDESLEHALYSGTRNQIDVIILLIRSFEWQKRTSYFEKGISIRNRARRLRTKDYKKFLKELRQGNELIRESTFPLARDTSAFVEDLRILYTSMMRDLQREFPNETQGWIWGTIY